MVVTEFFTVATHKNMYEIVLALKKYVTPVGIFCVPRRSNYSY